MDRVERDHPRRAPAEDSGCARNRDRSRRQQRMVERVLALPDQPGQLARVMNTASTRSESGPVVTTEAIIGRGKLTVQKRGSNRWIQSAPCPSARGRARMPLLRPPSARGAPRSPPGGSIAAARSARSPPRGVERDRHAHVARAAGAAAGLDPPGAVGTNTSGPRSPTRYGRPGATGPPVARPAGPRAARPAPRRSRRRARRPTRRAAMPALQRLRRDLVERRQRARLRDRRTPACRAGRSPTARARAPAPRARSRRPACRRTSRASPRCRARSPAVSARTSTSSRFDFVIHRDASIRRRARASERPRSSPAGRTTPRARPASRPRTRPAASPARRRQRASRAAATPNSSARGGRREFFCRGDRTRSPPARIAEQHPQRRLAAASPACGHRLADRSRVSPSRRRQAVPEQRRHLGELTARRAARSTSANSGPSSLLGRDQRGEVGRSTCVSPPTAQRGLAAHGVGRAAHAGTTAPELSSSACNSLAVEIARHSRAAGPGTGRAASRRPRRSARSRRAARSALRAPGLGGAPRKMPAPDRNRAHPRARQQLAPPAALLAGDDDGVAVDRHLRRAQPGDGRVGRRGRRRRRS